MNRCRICGKKLKEADAQFGDDCQRTFNDALSIIETTPEEVGRLFLTGDSTVQRLLRSMTTALICSIKAKRGTVAAYERRNARYFLDAARKEAEIVTDESVALAFATEGGVR